MWVSWVCDRDAGAAFVSRAALAFLAACLLIGHAADAAAKRAASDTTGEAKSRSRRVSISGDLHAGDRPVSVEISDSPRRDRKVVGLGPHIEIDADESIVRMFSDVTVDSTEHIDDGIVALFGSVTVDGDVTGDVVAVMGSVRLGPHATIGGDVVAVGGTLEQASGSAIHGESVALSLFPMFPGVPPLRALFLALLVLWLVAMLVGGLVVMLAPRRLARAAETISERTGWSLLTGFFLPPLCVTLAVLLMITLIGIPLAMLLPLFYLFALWMGAVVATYLMGCRLMGRPPSGSSPLGPILLGSLIVAVLFGFGAAFAGQAGNARPLALFFPMLGVLLATALSVIGSGALLVSMMGSRLGPREATAPAAAASPQPVAPPTS